MLFEYLLCNVGFSNEKYQQNNNNNNNNNINDANKRNAEKKSQQ